MRCHLRWLGVPAVVLLLSACATRPTSPPSPFGGCPPTAGAATAQLPELSLPCFTGGAQVRLAALHGPAVLNLWASSCGPCRQELPAMQRLADATAGRLTVLTVDSGDERAAGAAFATDVHVTLPTLEDPDLRLMGALGRSALPVTVFLDPAGRRFVYNAAPPDDRGLAALVKAHTGVNP